MKLWPTRTQSKSTNLIADLDSMIIEAVEFKLHGKIHKIKPVSNIEFFKFTNAYANLWDATNKKALPPEKIIAGYFEIISSVCDSVTLKDVQQMTNAQVGALVQLIMDQVTGRLDEKKTLEAMRRTAQSVVERSAPQR
jgi:hypothetical protein